MEIRAFDMWAGGKLTFRVIYYLVRLPFSHGCGPSAPNMSVFSLSATEVAELLKFLRPLHEGTLVFVASFDDPATK